MYEQYDNPQLKCISMVYIYTLYGIYIYILPELALRNDKINDSL